MWQTSWCVSTIWPSIDSTSMNELNNTTRNTTSSATRCSYNWLYQQPDWDHLLLVTKEPRGWSVCIWWCVRVLFSEWCLSGLVSTACVLDMKLICTIHSAKWAESLLLLCSIKAKRYAIQGWMLPHLTCMTATKLWKNPWVVLYLQYVY